MAKKGTKAKPTDEPQPTARPGKPSALLDTRVIYCGDNLEQLAKLPDFRVVHDTLGVTGSSPVSPTGSKALFDEPVYGSPGKAFFLRTPLPCVET